MIKFNKKYKYKDLCRALDLPPQRGSKLTTQIKSISQNYEIVKNGKYYIILKQYTPLEKAEVNRYNKNKNYLEPMLYTLLHESPSNVVRFDMKEMLQVLALVNKDYHFAKWHLEETDQLITQGDNGLEEFINSTEPMYKEIIKDVLKDMESRRLIQIVEIPMYARKYRGKNNKVYTSITEADNNIGKPAFLEAQRLAMKHFGYEHWEDMSNLNWYQWHEAKQIIEDYLKQELNVAYFYYEYEIILNKKGLNEMVTNNFNDLRKSFNKYIQEKTLNSKRQNLKYITQDHKDNYIKALIDIDTDYHIRDNITKEDTNAKNK
jgi:uncharacterized protein YaaW (UPF0174 family)